MVAVLMVIVATYLLFIAERENLLYSQRTSGRFVTDNEDNINQLREEVAKVEILSLYNILTKLGYKKEELIELVINNLKEMS